MNKLFAILFYCIVIELFVGGDGRILEFGTLSIRQILFVAALLLCVVKLSYSAKIFYVTDIDYLVFSFFTVCVLSAYIGLLSNHGLDLVLSDFKSRLSILLYPFFYLYFKINGVQIDRFKKLLLVCGCLVSILTLAFSLAIWIGLVTQAEFLALNMLPDGKSIFWVRGNGAVFYPSLFFSLIAFIILLFDPKLVKNKFLYFVLFICISIGLYTSLTKGLVLGHLTALGIWFFYQKEIKINKLAVGIGLASIIAFTIMNDLLSQIIIERSTDRGNVIRILSSVAALDSWARQPIFGTGFGQQLELKTHSLENSWLDVLMEQGFLGFAVLLCIIIKIVTSSFDRSFSISVVVMSFVSLTNPFFTNSLGLTFIALYLGWLKVYNEDK